jgi:MFS family permease
VTTVRLPPFARERNFAALWAGQTISTLGDSLTSLTLIILINHLTHSAAMVALLAVVIAIPDIAVSLFAGAYVDRFNRKRIMLASDFIRAVLLGLLAVTAIHPQVGLIFAIAFLQAAVGTFFNPARAAIMQVTVPAGEMLRANSLMQTTMVIAQLAGTSAAGVLVGLTGSYWLAFGIDGLTFIASFTLTAVLRAAGQYAPPGTPPASALRSVAEGLRVVRRNRVLLGLLMTFAALSFTLSPMAVLITPYAINVLHIHTVWLGVIQSGDTVGNIVGAVIIAILATRLRPPTAVTTGMILLAAVVASVSLASNVPELVAIFFAFGLVTVALQASMGALTQTTVDNAFVGRFMGLMGTIPATSSVLSIALAGSLASLIGVRTVLVGLAVVLTLASLLASRLLKSPRPSGPAGEQDLPDEIVSGDHR